MAKICYGADHDSEEDDARFPLERLNTIIEVDKNIIIDKSINEIDKLIHEIIVIQNKNIKSARETGAKFNIFNILEKESKEVSICKFLHELIDPNGSHHQNCLFLRMFVQNVLGLEFTENDYQTARVYREYPTKGKRRIDLLIETSNFKIPIEVKIYASDMNEQCYDYFKYAKNSKLYYLTIDGRLPAKDSTKGMTSQYDINNIILGYEEITPISWDDIINWLDLCLELPGIIEITPISSVILQFKEILCKITGKMMGGIIVDIVNRIILSPENMKSAVNIANALPAARSEVMRLFFSELKQLFENNNYTVHEEDKYTAFYQSRRQVYPCLTIEMKKMAKNIIAALFIEVDVCLYYGFSIMEWNSIGEIEFKKIKTISKKYPEAYNAFSTKVNEEIVEGETGENIILWNYLYDDKGRKYDFASFSDSCIELVNNYKNQTQNIFKMLNKFIQNILNKM